VTSIRYEDLAQRLEYIALSRYTPVRPFCNTNTHEGAHRGSYDEGILKV